MGGPPPGGPMGGPMVPGAPMAMGGAQPDLVKQATTWLILSCVTFICGCGLLAAVPAFFAWKAKQAAEAGDVAEFESKIKISKICVIVGFALSALGFIGWLVSFILAAMA
ncbi:MAG: hypothetical protein KIT72_14825 [Polyangiaceae bacterium]|nr:hypothetical protein [Polyangiaceae bacterium]